MKKLVIALKRKSVVFCLALFAVVFAGFFKAAVLLAQEPVWTVSLPNAEIRNVVSDESGNIYAVGIYYETGMFEGTKTDFFIAKFDPAGNQQWLKTINGPDLEWFSFNSVAYWDNKIYALLWEDPTGYGPADSFVVVYDTDGNQLLKKKVAEDSVSFGIKVDASGIYYCRSYGYNYLTKLDHNGDELWTIPFNLTGPAGEGMMTALSLDENGNVYFVATHAGSYPGFTNAGNIDLLFGEVSPEGDIIWVKQWGTSAIESSTSIAVYSDSIYIAGVTEWNMSGNPPRYFVMKMSLEGEELWLRKLGIANVDSGSLAVDASGVYNAGERTFSKLSHDNDLLWQHQGIGYSYAFGITVFGGTVFSPYANRILLFDSFTGNQIIPMLLISGKVSLDMGPALPSQAEVSLWSDSGSLVSKVNPDQAGNYVFSGLQIGSSFSVTAALEGYKISPAKLVFENISHNISGADFYGEKVSFTVSGTVSLTGGLCTAKDVKLALYLKNTGAKIGVFNPDENGQYLIGGLKKGTSYLLRPTLECYTFSPEALIFNNVSGDLTAVDFAGLVSGANPFITKILPRYRDTKIRPAKRMRIFGNYFGKFGIWSNVIFVCDSRIIEAQKIISWSETKIIVIVPWEVNDGYVKVMNAAGIESALVPLNVFEPISRITSITPAAKSGKIIVVYGSRFGPMQYPGSMILFADTPADVVFWKGGMIKVVVPSLSPGKIKVKVITYYGESNLVIFKVK